MEPGLRDRGHRVPECKLRMPVIGAAMEPGLRDRGHWREKNAQRDGWPLAPQWSPVFATGVTRLDGGRRRT